MSPPRETYSGHYSRLLKPQHRLSGRRKSSPPFLPHPLKEKMPPQPRAPWPVPPAAAHGCSGLSQPPTRGTQPAPTSSRHHSGFAMRLNIRHMRLHCSARRGSGRGAEQRASVRRFIVCSERNQRGLPSPGRPALKLLPFGGWVLF